MNVSIKITTEEIKLLQSMVGKNFEKFKCDSFVFSPMVYGLVGLYVEGKVYKFSAFNTPIQYFYVKEDIVKIKVEEAKDTEIVSEMDGGEFIENPVKSKISSITIVNEYQKVTHEEEERSLEFTVGIIFHLEDGHEISFEAPIGASEMIAVRKGYNLIKKFVSENDFLDEWQECKGYIASTKREVIVLDK